MVDFLSIKKKKDPKNQFPLGFNRTSASLQHQDAGSIPSLVRWVKGASVAAVAAA